MRFRELVENTTEELQSGPPYPKEDIPAVKDMQRMLSNAGYSVGSTGVDGKYGPRTARAVRAFKKDYKLPGDGLSMSKKGLEILAGIDSGVVPKHLKQVVLLPQNKHKKLHAELN